MLLCFFLASYDICRRQRHRRGEKEKARMSITELFIVKHSSATTFNKFARPDSTEQAYLTVVQEGVLLASHQMERI